MKLDLDALAKPKDVIVPVLNRAFLFMKKSYAVDVVDGWQRVFIDGNRVKPLEPSHPESDTYDTVQGYTHNDNIIFRNTNVAWRKWNFGQMAPLNFNQSATFESIRAVVWEDKRVYWLEPNYSDSLAPDFKMMFEEEMTIEHAKAVTPELRMTYLFHSIERQNFKKAQEDAKKAEEHERMMRDIPYRLQVTFQRSGAELIKYSLSGKRIVVDWRIPGSDFEYNSVIDRETWMILEAGFCMSQDDKRHNITSMIKLAEDYEDRNLIHITRS